MAWRSHAREPMCLAVRGPLAKMLAAILTLASRLLFRRRLPRCLLAMGLGAYFGVATAYEPQTNYMLQCMGCHTPDGSGEPGRVPSVKATLMPFASSAEGRRFLVQVPGAAQARLSDAELAELINWMIANLSVVKPGHFARFTAAEVASYRRTPLVEVRATRERLLRNSTGGAAPKS